MRQKAERMRREKPQKVEDFLCVDAACCMVWAAEAAVVCVRVRGAAGRLTVGVGARVEVTNAD